MSINLLRNSMQAKAHSFELAPHDEVIANLYDRLPQPEPPPHSSEAPADATLLARSARPPRRLRSRNKGPRGLDYSRWTRRTESRIFLPILSGSASSSAENLSDPLAGSRSASSRDTPKNGVTAGESGSLPAVAAPPRYETLSKSSSSANDRAQGATVKRPATRAVDDDEDMAEEERVELAIKTVKKQEGSLLREIHEIKERHKTLEALTLTRARGEKGQASAEPAVAQRRPAVAPTIAAARPRPTAGQRPEPVREALKKGKTLDAYWHDAGTKPRSIFKPDSVVVPSPGVAWTIRTPSPGARSKRPYCGAWKLPPPPSLASARSGGGKRAQLRQYTDVDLGSAYFLPQNVTDAKTPVEAALRLHKVLTDLSLLNNNGTF